MRVIKYSTDLTKVSFADRSAQLDDDILTVSKAILTDSDDNLTNSTRTRIFNSMRHFYVATAIVKKIFPFQDTVLKDLAVLNQRQLKDDQSLRCSPLGAILNSRREDLLKRDCGYLYNNCRMCAKHFTESQFMNPYSCDKLV